MPAADLLGDDGVLLPVPTLAVGTDLPPVFREVVPVFTWRADYLRARRAGRPAQVFGVDAVPGPFPQAVVMAEKSRAGTLAACGWAWERLVPGGRLVLTGDNRMGITATAASVADDAGVAGETRACRAHARAVAFVRGDRPLPVPVVPAVALPLGDAVISLVSAPGVFSAAALDRGTALLMEHCAGGPPPRRVVDCCCGIGPLGIAALHRWPDCRVDFIDADARAITCVERNLESLGDSDRGLASWWDVTEGAPRFDGGADLVLLNPPWHDGVAADLTLAQAALRLLPAMLAPAGRALVVANRTLPYEQVLSRTGICRVLAQTGGFKVLELRVGV